MDMVAGVKEQLVFHMTGKSAGEKMTPVDAAGLVPAALAPYRDLARLRYDFPLVLPDLEGHEPVSLSTAIGKLLADVAPRGMEGERLRRDVLRIEAGIRARVTRGEEGVLSRLWAEESAKLAPSDATAAEVLAQAGHSLHLDGAVVDCDARLPARYLRAAWRAAQARKAREFRRVVDGLVRKLSDIRRAAFARSAAGRRPEALAASVGGAHADVFDFAAMSRLVARNAPQDELPAARRARIEWALSVLRAEPFFADADASGGSMRYQFEYDNCAAAMDAYRARLPRLTQTVKAIVMAELESTGAYVDADHDPFFERYDEGTLTPDDLALFPDYLVTIPAGANDAPENAGLLDMLSSGFPVKVLVHQTDLLEESSIGTGHFAFGVRSARLATAAMGLGGMFVMQATGADLHAMRERVQRGVACRGPALFSVFVGAGPIGTLPPFLACAAARESRAFPAFVYDAAAGDNWATRFSLDGNRNPDDDWVVDPIDYADDDLQRVSEPAAFTYADFAMCDPRYARHFVAVPRDRWHDGMLPVALWLALPEGEAADHVPFAWAVDASDRLHRVIVDARMMQAAKRCLLLWHRLQEHAGIHDSHAERLLARERAAWEASKEPVASEAAPASPAVAAAAPAADEAAAPVEAPPSDDPWIETARCPSCNECQTINDKMFAYNENKQAYIKDITAGTYRQLVEAAEACQVAIIHPGKPRNPGEPGLAELMERAKPFL
ncbi:MAG: hypothetical protein U1F54_17570 [Burkholderiales bacterium]